MLPHPATATEAGGWSIATLQERALQMRTGAPRAGRIAVDPRSAQFVSGDDYFMFVAPQICGRRE